MLRHFPGPTGFGGVSVLEVAIHRTHTAVVRVHGLRPTHSRRSIRWMRLFPKRERLKADLLDIRGSAIGSSTVLSRYRQVYEIRAGFPVRQLIDSLNVGGDHYSWVTRCRISATL
jgi:hypothetical protein